ncbi:hypothetical protein HMPREF0602_2390 [Neisseria meningitidis ATCC 13091]|uniref:PilS cassette n=1 Tax=Neisseria meningitidis serogroup B (strain ATCC 13091 / M2091) TaxID=862513 RepID=E0ND08_NEIM3|nr:hypothetical protein HMPREF0602_2390 [Neisseria meningitidis ATCC 13091]
MNQKAIPIGKNPGGMAFLNFELLLHRHSSFPRRRESRNEKQQEFIGKTETPMPSFPRKRESRT